MKQTALLLAIFALIASCTTLPTAPAPAEPAPVETPEEPVVVTKDYSPYENFTVTKGEFSDKIVITWEGDPAQAWVLYRSLKDEEAYTKLADVTGVTTYTDTTVEKGLKVWYRLEKAQPEGSAPSILPAAESNVGALTDPEKDDSVHENFGYMKSKKPAGRKLGQVTATFTKGKPRYTAEEQEQVTKHFELIQKRILHPVKLNMVLTMSQPYFDSGKMAAYTDFESFSYDMPEREVFLFDKDKTYVCIFKSTVICRFIRENNDGIFLERLLYNGVAFSVDAGEREVKDAEGFTRILPAVDTVGFASAYYPKYANWKGNTAMFTTSRDSLQKELKKAQREPR